MGAFYFHFTFYKVAELLFVVLATAIDLCFCV
jgi:hypothetical protein